MITQEEYELTEREQGRARAPRKHGSASRVRASEVEEVA